MKSESGFSLAMAIQPFGMNFGVGAKGYKEHFYTKLIVYYHTCFFFTIFTDKTGNTPLF